MITNHSRRVEAIAQCIASYLPMHIDVARDLAVEIVQADPATRELEELRAENARLKDGTVWRPYADAQRELLEKETLLAVCSDLLRKIDNAVAGDAQS